MGSSPGRSHNAVAERKLAIGCRAVLRSTPAAPHRWRRRSKRPIVSTPFGGRLCSDGPLPARRYCIPTAQSQGQHANTTPPGVGAVTRQVEGTAGPAWGPMAPQLTANSSAWHTSTQVHVLAQPVVEEQPGVTAAGPGHCVGSLLRHPIPPPFGAVQDTNARAAPQLSYEASFESRFAHAGKAASPALFAVDPFACESVVAASLPPHAAAKVMSTSH
jgi:hypothetical protein